jgi:hypothetical protein
VSFNCRVRRTIADVVTVLNFTSYKNIWWVYSSQIREGQGMDKFLIKKDIEKSPLLLLQVREILRGDLFYNFVLYFVLDFVL